MDAGGEVALRQNNWGEFWLCPSSLLIMRQVKERVERMSFWLFSSYSIPFSSGWKVVCVCVSGFVWNREIKKKKKVYRCHKNRERSAGGVRWSQFLGKGSSFFNGKKGGDFISFQGPRVRKSCESNSCCFLFSKQRPRTHWKPIRHSGADVKWNPAPLSNGNLLL